MRCGWARDRERDKDRGKERNSDGDKERDHIMERDSREPAQDLKK